MKITKRSVVLLVAIALLIGCAAGGTMAWLIDSTDAVTNTFTTANVDIELTETFNTDIDSNGTMDTWTAKMVPGAVIEKNPVVTVKGGSEACLLFVKFEETNSPSTYLTYTSNLNTGNGWTQGSGAIPEYVWYREVPSSATDQSWHMLVGDTITVKGSVTKENMATAATAKLTYTAYAHQLQNGTGKFTAAEAWAALNS